MERKGRILEELRLKHSEAAGPDLRQADILTRPPAKSRSELPQTSQAEQCHNIRPRRSGQELPPGRYSTGRAWQIPTLPPVGERAAEAMAACQTEAGKFTEVKKTNADRNLRLMAAGGHSQVCLQHQPSVASYCQAHRYTYRTLWCPCLDLSSSGTPTASSSVEWISCCEVCKHQDHYKPPSS